MIRLFACLAVLASGCASMVPEEKWAIGLAVADLASTAIALEQGHEELNPILSAGSPSDEEIIARAAVANVLVHLLLRRWLSDPERGFDRRGWRLVIGVRMAPVLWNSRQIIEAQR